MRSKLLAAIALTFVASTALAADHTVQMKNAGAEGSMIFEPSVINVAVGDTVHFVPTDMGHNAESVAGLTPAGAATWKGGMGKKVSVTVDKEGVYVYQCAPHSIMAMVGVVVAGKPVNLEEIKANSAKLSASFLMNKDRLEKYLASVK